MTDTATGHQGAIQMFCIHIWGPLMLFKVGWRNTEDRLLSQCLVCLFGETVENAIWLPLKRKNNNS